MLVRSLNEWGFKVKYSVELAVLLSMVGIPALYKEKPKKINRKRKTQG